MAVTLVAFDFDHTLVDANSDTYIQRLCHGGRLPSTFRRSSNSENWIVFMNRVLHLLHETGVTPQQLLDFVSRVPWTPGMKDLLASLDQRRYQLIILSDANSVFIEAILQAAGLAHVFHTVLTNPASFDERGQLHVQPHHRQDWCQLSEENLCKGHLLDQYVAERREAGVTFHRVVYVGDGRNDYCPSLRLAKGDVVFARADMMLHSLLVKAGAEGGVDSEVVKAGVRVWKTGFDIMAELQRTEPQ